MTEISLATQRRTKVSRSLRRVAFTVLIIFGVESLGGGLGWIGSAKAANTTHEDLLIGYSLLEGSLSDETGLKWLLLVRKLTLNKPPPEIAKLMERISETSKKRAAEIRKLRKLKPEVTGKPPPSPVGDAIEASAKRMGTHEMVFPDGSFNMRFLFLQAQATRMIAVIATETAMFDENEERKKWLEALSIEYEGLRDELVASVKSCTPN